MKYKMVPYDASRVPIYDLGKVLKRTPTRWEIKEKSEGVYILERDYVKIRYNSIDSNISIIVISNHESVELALTKEELEYFTPCVEYVISYHKDQKERDALYQLEQKLIIWSQWRVK